MGGHGQRMASKIESRSPKWMAEAQILKSECPASQGTHQQEAVSKAECGLQHRFLDTGCRHLKQ